MQLFKLLSLGALVATALPSVLFVTGTISLPAANTTALIATIVWFVATPFWMGQPAHNIDDESPAI